MRCLRTSRTGATRWLALAAAVMAGGTGCGMSSTPFDAMPGVDTGPRPSGDVVDERPPCRVKTECDDHVFCNGEERCLAGRCMPGLAACDDEHSCTQDSCDEGARLCAHTPNHAMCGDGNAC